MSSGRLQIIPIENIPLIRKGDDIADIVFSTLNENQQEIHPGDILLISHKVVSKSEGNTYKISEISPSTEAQEIAEKTGQSQMKVEIALRDSVSIIRKSPVLITKTRQGLITDYSGVDQSNAPDGSILSLPENPDESANIIQSEISKKVGFHVPVIITDTQGRPWRKGAVNVAIGIAGMSPFIKNAGLADLYGRSLRSSLVCIADEIASAAELLMGQADEKIPVIIVRGAIFESQDGNATSIIRDSSENLFS